MNQAGLFRVQPGVPLPLGATITERGVNFSVFSRHATGVTLVLFHEDASAPAQEYVLNPVENRTGDIWHIHVSGVDSSFQYAYRADGRHDPKNTGHRFQKDALLLDPYAKAIAGAERWGIKSEQRRCRIVDDRFDWEGDRPLNRPLAETVIYELHVRGYTIDPSSGVRQGGTFKGLTEKIPYIKSLGVTAVELLPIYEFDEMEKKPANPKTGEPLKNFWGYGCFNFFSPKAAYGTATEDGGQVREFKEMVKAFHREGIEVIIDVVYNHTAERDAQGPTVTFRGLDNVVYYAIDPATKAYVNISGCGNTLNCNHPVVHSLIIDSLRYWVLEMHVDGFRFDLAAILKRDGAGALINGPSLIDDIEKDPILAQTKIIAEAWDMGAHLVGGFPGRWIEWNSFFKDDVRRFVRGDSGKVPLLATRLAGSSDLYRENGRSPLHGVNYITCHDGFTLHDLVSYDKKHNENNGEDNRDGTDDNASSNCGVEGPTDDPTILTLRRRRVKTFFTLLMVSQGIPMVLAGDEFGRTQQGNNNAYCQDNVVSWVDWTLADRNSDLLRFFRMIVALRKRHPVFRRSTFLTGEKNDKEDWPDISWHGKKVDKPDWAEGSKGLSFLLNGMEHAHPSREKDGDATITTDNDFFIMVNGDDAEHTFELPDVTNGTRWLRLVDTSKTSPADIVEEKHGVAVSDNRYSVSPSAAAVFMASKT